MAIKLYNSSPWVLLRVSGLCAITPPCNNHRNRYFCFNIKHWGRKLMVMIRPMRHSGGNNGRESFIRSFPSDRGPQELMNHGVITENKRCCRKPGTQKHWNLRQRHSFVLGWHSISLLWPASAGELGVPFCPGTALWHPLWQQQKGHSTQPSVSKEITPPCPVDSSSTCPASLYVTTLLRVEKGYINRNKAHRERESPSLQIFQLIRHRICRSGLGGADATLFKSYFIKAIF